MPESSKKLLTERGREYGLAWWYAGEVIGHLGGMRNFYDEVMESGYFHNWVLILSKMMRIIQTPTKIDHWRDIAGYATLVADHIEQYRSEEQDG